MCVLSIKVPIRKKSGNLFNDPRIYSVRVFFLLAGHFDIGFFFQTIQMFLVFSFFMKVFRKYQFVYLFIHKLDYLVFFSFCQS